MRLATLFPSAATAMNLVGADALLGAAHRGVGSVIVMHSVVRDRRDHLLDRLRTSASFLETLIAHYIASGVPIITLDEALARLQDPSTKRFVCFTFDDGYRDNLSLALPIFERHGVPLTVFVTSCFLDRSMNVWWAGLVELLKRVDSLEVSALGRAFDTSTFEKKVHAYRLLGGTVSTGALSAQAVSDLLRSHGISCEAILDRDALAVSEVRELTRHPLVTVGGHTHSHPRLSRLSLPDARREMKRNKDLLEQLADREVHHFAYPHGDRASCGEREFALARELGFRSGLTTQIGNLGRKHLSCPTGLPRLRPFNQHESIRLLEFQRSGAANAIAPYFANDIAIA